MIFRFSRFMLGVVCFSLVFYVLNHFLNEGGGRKVEKAVKNEAQNKLIQECKQSLVGSGLYALSGLRRVSDRETVSKGEGKGMVRYWISASTPSSLPRGWVCAVRYDDRGVIESVYLSFE